MGRRYFPALPSGLGGLGERRISRSGVRDRADRKRKRAAIDRYLLVVVGPTAANSQQRQQGTDGQTTGRTQDSFTDPAGHYYVGNTCSYMIERTNC